MKKITIKIFLLSIIPTIIVGVVTGIMFSTITGDSGKSSIFAYESTMRRDFDTTAKWETETVKTVIDAIYKRYIKGEISLIETKKLSAEIIRGLKYGKDGYFWVDSIDGTNIVSSVKEFEGKNRFNAQDVDGKYFIQDFINKGIKGGGFSDYRFPKSSDGQPLPKRSYLLLYKPFGWVIGTGNYIDDIDNEVAVMKKEQTIYLSKMIKLIIGLLIFATIVVIFLSKKMSKPIVILSKKVEQISTGNLNISLSTKSKDEIGQLAKSLETMIFKWKEIIITISDEANNISTTGIQLKNSALTISNSAIELASSAEEVASSMEEMNSNIMQNTENAKITEKIVTKVAEDIRTSSRAVKKTAAALKTITERSSVINEIAAKTNILALNASVEAALAGEHGKSFSVIAKEIRALAEQSKNAALKIDGLSKTGIDISEKSVLLLEKLIPDIEKTNDLVLNIHNAGIEQNLGAMQINEEIQHLNIVSQRNAAISQETETNSVSLTEQANILINSISFFKIEK